VLVRHEWFSPAGPNEQPQLEGSKIDLAAITTAPAKRNLVLFISETCYFCEQEMPFYRTLREKLPSQASLVAVFPPQEPEPAKFLAGKDVKVDHVASTLALASIGVRGTPTLLLVDEKGKVERAWVGAQQPAIHDEIVASVSRNL